MHTNKNSIESQLGRDKEKQGERHEGLLQDSREHARGGDISSGSTFSNKNDNKTSSTFSDQSSNLTK